MVGIRHFLEELGIWFTKPVVIYEDNKPTIQVTNNASSLGDTGRHSEIKMFKLKELVENQTVILQYIETMRQVADLLTKSLGRVAFERLRNDLTGAFENPMQNIHVPLDAILMRIITTLS